MADQPDRAVARARRQAGPDRGKRIPAERLSQVLGFFFAADSACGNPARIA